MIRMKKMPFVFVLLGVLGGMSSARADEDAERETLAQIAYEVERLQQAVSDAGKQAGSATRIRFRYDWLSQDLELIRRGIEDHLDRPRQPRPAPPLKGDYRQ